VDETLLSEQVVLGRHLAAAVNAFFQSLSNALSTALKLVL